MRNMIVADLRAGNGVTVVEIQVVLASTSVRSAPLR
jgi:hypothetical protein